MVHVRTGASLVRIAGRLRRDEEIVDFFSGLARDFTFRVEERPAVTEAFDDIEFFSGPPTTRARQDINAQRILARASSSIC